MHAEQLGSNKKSMSLQIQKCTKLYSKCGPAAGCNKQHKSTRKLDTLVARGFKLATPKRSGRNAAVNRGSLEYLMTPLAEQQIRNGLATI